MRKRRELKNSIRSMEQTHSGEIQPHHYDGERLCTHASENEEVLRFIFDKSVDVVFYPFTLFDNRKAMLLYSEVVSDSKHISSDILLPLTKSKISDVKTEPEHISIRRLAREYVTVPETKQAETFGEIVKYVMHGYAVLLVDAEAEAIGFSTVKRRDRAIEEPSTEAIIRGPREGFNENIATSISLIRRRLPTPDLKIESFMIGKYSKTDVAVCYVDGIVEPDLVDEVLKRLNRIEIDSIIDSAYIEELIEDHPFTPFPQIQNTERPDVAAAFLLEGKVVILTDGSPFALIAPVNLWSAIHAAEDHYERYMVVNLIRWLRFTFLAFALFLPSLYVAITTFHQEMLPTKLLLSVAAAREVTPLPAVVEALLMEVTFEALREAGVRLPKTIGSSISIVGALVIGQAAVQAGMASAPMVIIVSITGIASFAIPRFNFAISIRMLRFPIIILAGTLGLFGIVFGMLIIMAHLCALRSFGKPFLEPIAPFNWNALKDTFVRVPRWAMTTRPLADAKQNPQRQTTAAQPSRRIPKSN